MKYIFASLMWFGISVSAFAGQSLIEYADMCTAEIGEIPAFDCTQGTIVPITVNGVEPTNYTKDMLCDRPALLPYPKNTFGQCTPYSRIHNLSKGDKQISAFCRREMLRAPDSPLYDEVDIILHSVKTGATCWFHAENKSGNTAGFDASRVPPPNEKIPPPGKVSAEKFWWKPARTAEKDCGACHDADPFMYSPWIGQKWAQVPQDPLGKYIHLGKDFTGKGWESAAISTRDNTCIGCHRIGNKQSCSNYIQYASGMKLPTGVNQLASSYPLNHWMPVQNNQSESFWQHVHQGSVNNLLTCCNNPLNPMCTLTPITQKK